MADAAATVHLQRCLDRLQAGEAAARDELLDRACGRLTHLTRRLLKDHPSVRRWEETGDVLQNALLRLCRALQGEVPTSVRGFFRLSATVIRRELIDLARHYYGPQGLGAHHASHLDQDRSDAASPAQEPAERTHEPSELAMWGEFHQQVEALPEDEREVFDLLWYQGLSQGEAAELLGVSERTVQRRWQAARVAVFRALHGGPPESSCPG
jgi:RNA polymerase sigma-70 factor (ECF subfamily)